MAIIHVTEDGPYRVEGEISIRDCTGKELRSEGIWHLCRCGGSRNKPFCDSTHGLKGWSGPETASHDQIAERRDVYPGDGVTVYDDRTRCAHFGQCSDRLPRVFRSAEEPFVAVSEAPAKQIVEVTRGCPSGALATSEEEHETFVAYLEWGSRIAVFNSKPGVEMIKHAPVPKWGWGNSSPYVPQPWDDPEAATKGRERYAREHSAMPQDRDPHVQPEGQSPSR